MLVKGDRRRLGGQVDDAPTACGEHHLPNGLAHEERPADVDAHRGVPIGDGESLRRGQPDDARAIDKDVYPAVALGHPGDARPDGLWIGDIAAAALCGAPSASALATALSA